MVKEVWGAGLAGVAGTQIVSGLQDCMKKPWPPTLPEFLALCVPPPDYEQLFNLAASNPRASALAFAACRRFGEYELRRASWSDQKARARFIEIVEDLLGCEVPPVPEAPAGLEYKPELNGTAKDRGKETLAILKELARSKTSHE